MQEVDEEIHACLGFLPRQPVDSPEEDQGVADGELVVQRQVLQGKSVTCSVYDT